MELAAAICIITAGILWGTMGIFVRTLGAWGFSTIQITAFRIILGALMYFIFLAVTDRSKIKIKWRDIPLFIGLGIGSIFLMSVSYFSTIQLTSLSVAAILLYTAPIFVMIMSVLFLKEKMSGRKVLALMAAFAGCVCVTGIGADVKIGTVGIATGLLSGISYALYSILGTFALRKYHPYTVSAYAFGFAAIAELCLCNVPEMAHQVSEQVHPERVLGVAFLMAFVTAFAPYLLYTVGLKKIEAGKAAIMATVEPLVASVIGVLVFREALNAVSIVGIVLIILAIAILNNFGRREADGKTSETAQNM